MTTDNKAAGKATIERIGTPSKLDHDVVRELAQLLEETELTEIEIERAGFRIRVARQPSTAILSQGTIPPQSATSPPASQDASLQAAADAASHPGAVASPMVGTAYVAAKPGDPAFVSVGDNVAEGQTVMIIEAMKTMNPIPAPRAGRISQILVSDAQPVEFGEPLLIID